MVFNVARDNDAKLVLSPCLDQQINIAMKVAEKLGIAHPFSSETALKVTNKKLMKEIMMEGDIPTSRYYVVDENTDIDSIKLTYPVIVKPADSCGSAGIIKLETEKGLKQGIKDSISWGNSGKVIVEEFVEGAEMGVHGYVENGKIHLLFGTCKITAMKNDLYQQLCNIYIPKLKPSLQRELEGIARKIVEKFNLPAYTPMFMQVIVKEDKASVIEFSPRVAGGITSSVAYECAGFDLLNYSIDSYLGTQETTEEGHLEQFVCCYPLYCKEGIFDHVSGYEELLQDKTVSKIFFLKEQGDHIDMKKPSSSNVVKYLIEGKTPEECLLKLRKADTNTEIYNIKGKSMRDYSFSLTEELFTEKLKEIIG